MVLLVGIFAAIAPGTERRDHHQYSVANNSLVSIPRKLVYGRAVAKIRSWSIASFPARAGAATITPLTVQIRFS